MNWEQPKWISFQNPSPAWHAKNTKNKGTIQIKLHLTQMAELNLKLSRDPRLQKNHQNHKQHCILQFFHRRRRIWQRNNQRETRMSGKRRGVGAHWEIGEVVREVRDVIEEVAVVALLELGVGGVVVGEAHGGGVPEGAEVWVRVAGDPHARGREWQRLRHRRPLLMLVPWRRRRVVVLLHRHAQRRLLLLRQNDVRRHQ